MECIDRQIRLLFVHPDRSGQLHSHRESSAVNFEVQGQVGKECPLRCSWLQQFHRLYVRKKTFMQEKQMARRVKHMDGPNAACIFHTEVKKLAVCQQG